MTLTRQHNPYMVSDFRISLLVPLASKFLTLNTHRLSPEVSMLLQCSPSYYSAQLFMFHFKGKGGGKKRGGFGQITAYLHVTGTKVLTHHTADVHLMPTEVKSEIT